MIDLHNIHGLLLSNHKKLDFLVFCTFVSKFGWALRRLSKKLINWSEILTSNQFFFLLKKSEVWAFLVYVDFKHLFVLIIVHCYVIVRLPIFFFKMEQLKKYLQITETLSCLSLNTILNSIGETKEWSNWTVTISVIVWVELKQFFGLDLEF